MDAVEKSPVASSVLSSPSEQTNAPRVRPLIPGEYISNPDGSRSTEITRTFQTESGEWVNAPSLWMGNFGHVRMDSEEDIYRTMKAYEASTGKKFPRYKTVEEAVSFAKARSNRGGVFSGSLSR